jgi:hypothetical protein
MSSLSFNNLPLEVPLTLGKDNASRQDQVKLASSQEDWASLNKLMYNSPTPNITKLGSEDKPQNKTLLALQMPGDVNSPSYDSGLSARDRQNTYRFDKRENRGDQTSREIAFEKGVDTWVNGYVPQRFPAPLREKANILLKNILLFYGDKPEQPYIRDALKNMLSSSGGRPDNPLGVLEALRLEISGAKPHPLVYSRMTPLNTMEYTALQNMGRRSFNDVTDMIASVKGISTTNTETLTQTRDRVRAEGHVRKFAQSLGQTNVTNITIKPRDPNNIIALTHQESSATFMKSPMSFASDISYDSKAPGGVPIRSKFTVWFNPSIFGRVGMPYVDSKGGAVNPDTNKKVPPTLQSVIRAGFFEAGIQGNVGLNTSTEQARYSNAGFSMALRGPSFKAVLDFNPNGPKNLPEPKKTFTGAPSFNMSVDMSGYVTLGIFRGGPYLEIGRFAKGKSPVVFDKFNLSINPEFIRDVQEGRFGKLGPILEPYKNLPLPLSPY